MKNKFTWSGAVFAGLLIGFGNIVYCCANDVVVGALLFAFALCSVRVFGLDLYTGSFNKVILYKEFKFWWLLPILLLNFVGIGFCYALSTLCGFSAPTGLLVAKFYNANPLNVFFLAVCCGIMMSIATYPTTPLWLTVMCVMVFLLTGMRHSIANFWYIGFLPNEMCGSALGLSLLEIVGNALGGFAAASFITLNAGEKVSK